MLTGSTEATSFAQLYLLIDKIEQGGIMYDRDGHAVAAAALLANPDEGIDVSELQDSLPKRSLYVTYKAFPSFEKLSTSIAHQQSTPVF